MSTHTDLFIQGRQLEAAGQLAQAETLYQRLLEQTPNHVEALSQLGFLMARTGRLQEAKTYLERSLALQPNQPQTHYTLGEIYENARLFQPALNAYRQAIAFAPQFAEAYFALGYLLQEMEELEVALNYFQQSVTVNPQLAEAYFNMGLALQKLERPGEAKQAFLKALQLKPMDLAMSHIGAIEMEEGHVQVALEYLENAYRLNPNAALTLNNLGNVYKELANYSKAIECYQKAIQLEPHQGRVYFNLGSAFQKLDQLEAAESYYKQAVQLEPNLPEGYKSLAGVYLEQRKDTEALALYEQLIADSIKDGIRVQAGLALPALYHSTEDIRFWRQRFLENATHFQQMPLQVRNPAKEIDHTSFYLAYHGLNNKPLQEAVGKLYSHLRPWQTEIIAPQNTKPKIGFISKLFRAEHTIGHVFLGLINQLSQDLFDVVVFTVETTTPPPVTRPHLHIGLPGNDLDEAARQVASQHVDILLYTDIGMDPFTYFLAFNRLAPVQCVTWGHPDTTGIPAMDYYLSSTLFEAPTAQTHYSEKLALLNTVPTYYTRPKKPDTAVTRQDFGYSDQQHLYLCPQSLFKFHPDFDAILGGILSQDPQGLLLLANISCRTWKTILFNRLQKSVVPDVLERIVILEKLAYSKFLSLLTIGDVMLDTLYFGGGRTTYEALSYGTPIVTMPTEFMRGRMAYGCYQKMGVTECIAETPDDYINLAVRLGTEPDFRQAVKSNILEASSVLFEDMNAVRELETFFLSVLPK